MWPCKRSVTIWPPFAEKTDGRPELAPRISIEFAVKNVARRINRVRAGRVDGERRHVIRPRPIVPSGAVRRRRRSGRFEIPPQKIQDIALGFGDERREKSGDNRLQRERRIDVQVAVGQTHPRAQYRKAILVAGHDMEIRMELHPPRRLFEPLTANEVHGLWHDYDPAIRKGGDDRLAEPVMVTPQVSKVATAVNHQNRFGRQSGHTKNVQLVQRTLVKHFAAKLILK